MKPSNPYKRTYEDGTVKFIARYVNPLTGKREYAKPATHDTYEGALRAILDAQGAAQERKDGKVKVTDYGQEWPERHPRGERTNETRMSRVKVVVRTPIGQKYLKDVTPEDVRGVVNDLFHDGRTINGIRAVVATMAKMWDDARRDGLVEENPWQDVHLSNTDSRLKAWPREVRVYSYDEMHAFAACAKATRIEALVLTLSDCGLRIGEALGLRLEDFDGENLTISGTAHKGRFYEARKYQSKHKIHKRTVPVPPDLAQRLEGLKLNAEEDQVYFFPTQRGHIYDEANFYTMHWRAMQDESGLDIRPHEMRHSYVSTLRAAGIDDADLAKAAGHTVETLLNTYTHALNRSADKIRMAVG